MTLSVEVTQGSHDHPVTFWGHKHCDSGDIMTLVCQIIFQDHVTIQSFNFMGKALKVNHILPSFMAIDNMVVEIY